MIQLHHVDQGNVNKCTLKWMWTQFLARHSNSEFWASLCKATYSTRERNSCCDKVLFLLLFFGGLFCHKRWLPKVKIHCPYLSVLIKTYHKKVCPNLYIYLLYFVVYKRHLIYVYVHVQLVVSCWARHSPIFVQIKGLNLIYIRFNI
jgi:hypothetical protein